MNTLSDFRPALRLGCVVALITGAAALQAQTANAIRAPQTANTAGSLRTAPQPVAPATVTPGAATPSPGGLTSRFPAGLPSPLPNPAGLPSPTTPNLASPGTPPGTPPVDAGSFPATNVMGAAAATGVPEGPVAGFGGAYTPLQIAQSFFNADVNHDGELNRAEARRLVIAPYSFEEIDRNRDGIISRFEYEDAVR